MAKNNRAVVTEREFFSYQKRMELAKKSKYRCAHCGKALDIKTELSVDHAIPFSCGGTNEDINLVILCPDCNQDKRNDIVEIDYFKYLIKGEQKKLKEYIDNYINKYNWFTNRNFCPYTRFTIEACISKTNYATKKFTVKKAWINENSNDFERLTEFITKWEEKHNFDPGIDITVEDDLISTYKKGAIYYIENSNGEIILAQAIMIEQQQLINCSDEREHSIISFLYPMAANDNYIYGSIILALTDYITGWIVKLGNEEKIALFPINNTFYLKDKSINDLITRDYKDDRLGPNVYDELQNIKQRHYTVYDYDIVSKGHMLYTNNLSEVDYQGDNILREIYETDAIRAFDRFIAKRIV